MPGLEDQVRAVSVDRPPIGVPEHQERVQHRRRIRTHGDVGQQGEVLDEAARLALGRFAHARDAGVAGVEVPALGGLAVFVALGVDFALERHGPLVVDPRHLHDDPGVDVFLQAPVARRKVVPHVRRHFFGPEKVRHVDVFAELQALVDVGARGLQRVAENLPEYDADQGAGVVHAAVGEAVPVVHGLQAEVHAYEAEEHDQHKFFFQARFHRRVQPDVREQLRPENVGDRAAGRAGSRGRADGRDRVRGDPPLGLLRAQGLQEVAEHHRQQALHLRRFLPARLGDGERGSPASARLFQSSTNGMDSWVFPRITKGRYTSTFTPPSEKVRIPMRRVDVLRHLRAWRADSRR